MHSFGAVLRKITDFTLSLSCLTYVLWKGPVGIRIARGFSLVRSCR